VEELAFIILRRSEGAKWKEIEVEFSLEFGREVPHDNLRMAVKNNGNTPTTTKPKIKQRKVTRVIESDLKLNDPESYDCVMVISDMHIPYHHPDTFEFLEAVDKLYQPDKIVCIGDEVDKHAMSFHDNDPDLPSAGDELTEAIEYLKDLYKIFPEMLLVDSNHGSMHYRKGKHHGIPRKYLRGYNEILEAPEGWRWYNEVNLMCGQQKVRFKHSFSKNGLKACEQAARCQVQGHYHEDFGVQYSGNSDRLIWAMTVGCLIDDDSLAFAYNNTNAKRPILGVGIIENGRPTLIPMMLDKKGRWIKEI
jgi:predicted phosphodiesterase